MKMTDGNVNKLAARLTGKLVGTVSEVDEILHSPHMGRACIAKARVNSTMPTLGYDSRQYGIGVAFNRTEAFNAAVMEAVERTCMVISADTPIETTSVRSLRRRSVDHVAPWDLCYFLDEQYAQEGFPLVRPPAAADECLWLRGTYVVNGSEVLVPAEYCVDVPARRSKWWQVTSNGMGAGASRDAACLSALLELLERDAVLAMWYQRIELPHIDVMRGGGSRLAKIVEKGVEPSGLQCRFIDLSSIHGIPTCLAVVWSNIGGRDVYGFGSAAHPSWAVTIEKALREAIGTHYTASRSAQSARIRSIAAKEIRSFADRVVYYLDARNQVHLDWLTRRQGDFAVPVDWNAGAEMTEPSATLEWLTAKLGEVGERLVAVDLSPRGADALDVHVHRVVSPDLIPLSVSHVAMPIGHERMHPDGMESTRMQVLDRLPHPIV